MSEDESVAEYNERVLEIANESFDLGEKIPESKIVECGGVGHYQAECLTFLGKQKKNLRATLSDEDTDDSEEDYGCTNAIIVNIIETDYVVEDEIEDSEEESENNLSFEQLKIKWKNDSEARTIWKDGRK
ncbi:gag-pol polyprotein [Cucumis melo var. makuwa]|uniref:Gag-pol polyprotein n=1 Tax=Cucumis melo var. makuwa TaxID=1194695 RepID=A0A5A7SR36_CUCMM|nr:gag-pol polyprotein [Cucumis melo var. makuwa]